MAAGKRREERMRAYEHAGLIWTLAMNPITELAASEFIRCGALPGGKSERAPFNPEVEKKVAEYHRTGKLIVEPVHSEERKSP